MTKRESRKQRSNWPAMQRSLFINKRLSTTNFTNNKKLKIRALYTNCLF
ncbi:hypothetical protein [Porphyromonas pogonae]|nr:hypothetical protein [Porphyromonas pogonae]